MHLGVSDSLGGVSRFLGSHVRADEERHDGTVIVFKPLDVVSDMKYARIIDTFWKLRYMIGAGSISAKPSNVTRPPALLSGLAHLQKSLVLVLEVCLDISLMMLFSETPSFFLTAAPGLDFQKTLRSYWRHILLHSGWTTRFHLMRLPLLRIIGR